MVATGRRIVEFDGTGKERWKQVWRLEGSRLHKPNVVDFRGAHRGLREAADEEAKEKSHRHEETQTRAEFEM